MGYTSVDMGDLQLTISEFARLSGCSRQNISSLVKKGLLILTDGKLDPEDPTNKFYLQQRKENPRVITNPGKPAEPKPEPIKKKPKTTRKKKTVKKKKEKATPEAEKESGSEQENKTKKEKPLSQIKQELEIEKLREQHVKLVRENAEGRAELVRRDSLGDTVFGYLSALNQNIMSMPKTFIDEFESGIKSKSTRSQLTDILTKPICEAITETKNAIKKEITKARKEAKKINE